MSLGAESLRKLASEAEVIDRLAREAEQLKDAVAIESTRVAPTPGMVPRSRQEVNDELENTRWQRQV
jgi:hypothetical protein